MYSAYESTDEIFVKRYYKNLGTQWINVKNMRYCFQLARWIFLFHEDCCFPFEVPRINIMSFIFYFHCSFDASLIWLRPDIPKWYIGRNCALGVSPNSTRKGSARHFRRKPVFMRFPAFITSQHVQIVQITSSWTLGCFTQIEIKQLSCTIVEWVQFRNSDLKKKKKKHLNQNSGPDCMNSSQLPCSGTWCLVSSHSSSSKHFSVFIYAFHSLLISDKNFQQFLPLRKVAIFPQFL